MIRHSCREKYFPLKLKVEMKDCIRGSPERSMWLAGPPTSNTTPYQVVPLHYPAKQRGLQTLKSASRIICIACLPLWESFLHKVQSE